MGMSCGYTLWLCEWGHVHLEYPKGREIEAVLWELSGWLKG